MLIMKYLKIVLTVMAVSLAISSCTKTPAFEGQATVGFESEFISNNYGSDIIYIPVVFQGTSNVFPIDLDIEIVAEPEYDGDGYPAVEDVDYYLTSTDLSFARPEDYDELVDENGSVTITKNLEVRYPDATKDELRFKLRINSTSVEGVQITTSECVVAIAKPDVERLVGNYVVSGQRYDVEISGSDTTYVAAEEVSYDVVMEVEGSRLVMRNLFSTESQIANGEGTAIYFTPSETEERTFDVPLNFNNGKFYSTLGMYMCPSLISEDNEILDTVLKVTYDSTFSGLTFDDTAKNNLLTFVIYNSAGVRNAFFRKDSFLKNITITKK